MTELILSIIAAIFLVALGAYAVSKQRFVANVSLCLSVLLLAGVELFDQLSLRSIDSFAMFKRISLLLESFLPVAFLIMTFTFGRSRPFEMLSKMRLGLMAALALFPLVLLVLPGNEFYYSPDFQSEKMLFLSDAGYWSYIGIMLSLIVSLVNVETTLTETHGIARNRMKFEAIGIMSMVAVMIFYYSQGLLYRTINMNLVPIRSSVFIISAILIGYSRAFRGSETRVSISRHVMLRSITLLTVGAYLLVLGLIGEGMRYFGVSFGRNLTVILAFAGGVLLLAVFFSDNMRRRTRVYIDKHFYASNKHDYREEWIKLTSRLSLCASINDVQESILTAFRETFGVAGASLYLLSRDHRRYIYIRVSEQAMPKSPVALEISQELNDYFVQRERVLNLGGTEFPLSETERSVFSRAGAWLAIPLINNKKSIGLAVLREQIVPDMLIYDDFDLMKVLARQAAQAITNIRLSEEVMEMRAMSAVSKISTFVIHDLKNLTTGLSLCVDNAEEYIGNPDFQKDAITTMRNTLFKMNDLMQRLRSIPEKTSLDSRVKDIDRLSREVVDELAKLRPKRIVYQGEPVFARVDREEMKKVVLNLIQNALDASGEKGSVLVETRRENNSGCIRVSDSGVGMTDEFMKNDLFRPFRTTKKTGLGIGLYHSRQIVEAHDGRIDVRSQHGKGSVFTICLPAAEADE